MWRSLALNFQDQVLRIPEPRDQDLIWVRRVVATLPRLEFPKVFERSWRPRRNVSNTYAVPPPQPYRGNFKLLGAPFGI